MQSVGVEPLQGQQPSLGRGQIAEEYIHLSWLKGGQLALRVDANFVQQLDLVLQFIERVPVVRGHGGPGLLSSWVALQVQLDDTVGGLNLGVLGELALAVSDLDCKSCEAAFPAESFGHVRSQQKVDDVLF